MFCFNCKEDRNFVEVKPYSMKYNYNDFLLEFENGNFDSEGNRIEQYGLFKQKIMKELNLSE